MSGIEILSIIKLSGSATALAFKFYRIASEIGSIDCEAQVIAAEMTAFAQALETTSMIVDLHCLGSRYLDRVDVLMNACRQLIHTVNAALSDLLDRRPLGQWRHIEQLRRRTSFYLKQGQISRLRRSIESLKSTLILFNTTMNLEHAYKNGAPKSAQECLTLNTQNAANVAKELCTKNRQLDAAADYVMTPSSKNGITNKAGEPSHAGLQEPKDLLAPVGQNEDHGGTELIISSGVDANVIVEVSLADKKVVRAADMVRHLAYHTLRKVDQNDEKTWSWRRGSGTNSSSDHQFPNTRRRPIPMGYEPVSYTASSITANVDSSEEFDESVFDNLSDSDREEQLSDISNLQDIRPAKSRDPHPDIRMDGNGSSFAPVSEDRLEEQLGNSYDWDEDNQENSLPRPRGRRPHYAHDKRHSRPPKKMRGSLTPQNHASARSTGGSQMAAIEKLIKLENERREAEQRKNMEAAKAAAAAKNKYEEDKLAKLQDLILRHNKDQLDREKRLEAARQAEVAAKAAAEAKAAREKERADMKAKEVKAAAELAKLEAEIEAAKKAEEEWRALIQQKDLDLAIVKAKWEGAQTFAPTRSNSSILGRFRKSSGHGTS